MTESFDVYRDGSYHEVINKGLVGRQWSLIHQMMEKPYQEKYFERILEVGAGVGEHFPHVKSKWGQYVLSDIRIERLQAAMASESSVEVQEADVTSLPFDNDEFDRVISTCLLPHVSDPVAALSEIHRVAKNGGSITIYLPCEPGLVLRIARSLTTIPKNKRLSVPDPYFLHFREHIHYFTALNHFLLREFRSSTIRSRFYPLPMLSWNLNLIKIYQINVSK